MYHSEQVPHELNKGQWTEAPQDGKDDDSNNGDDDKTKNKNNKVWT